MSVLDLAIKGKTPNPPRIIIYGQEGVGKSTWAANAPDPIFIQTEEGLDNIDCTKLPLCKSVMMVLEQLRAIVYEKHNFQTVVIDSIDWLEKLIFAQIVKDQNKDSIKSIEDIGYAKGYVFALEYWKAVVEKLDDCRAKGMIVILVGHAKIERYEDPEVPAFDRFSPKLHKLGNSYLCEWADAVLFATRRKAVRKEGSGFNERSMAVGVGEDGAGMRVLKPNGSPACVAKNRFGITQAEIPLAFNEFFNLVVTEGELVSNAA